MNVLAASCVPKGNWFSNRDRANRASLMGNNALVGCALKLSTRLLRLTRCAAGVKMASAQMTRMRSLPVPIPLQIPRASMNLSLHQFAVADRRIGAVHDCLHWEHKC